MSEQDAAAPATQEPDVTIIDAGTISVSDLIDGVEELSESTSIINKEDEELLDDLSDIEATVSAAATTSFVEVSSSTSSTSSNMNKRGMDKRSPQASPQKEMYSDAEASRVNSGTTTDSSLTSGAKKARQEAKDDRIRRIQLIREEFQGVAIGLGIRKIQMMAELDDASIHLIRGLIPDFLPTAKDISLDLLGELEELEPKKRMTYLQQFSIHLFERQTPMQIDPTETVRAQHASHRPNGNQMPEATHGQHTASQADTESMSERSWADQVEDEIALGDDPEEEPPSLGTGPYADLVQSLVDGSHVQGDMSTSGFSGKAKTHTECAQYGNFTEALWSTPGSITDLQVADRLEYIELHAHNPGSILTGPLPIHDVPWKGSLPCGQQPLLLLQGSKQGACKKCMKWGMCATDTCWDQHYSRGRVGCVDKGKCAGEGKVWWVWFDRILEDVEKTCPGAIPQLAHNWREHVLHAIAHRRWKEKCEMHLQQGLEDPITLAKAAYKAANAERLRNATANAATRATTLANARAPAASSGPTPSNSPMDCDQSQSQSQSQWREANPRVGNHGTNHRSDLVNRGARSSTHGSSRDRPRGRGRGKGHPNQHHSRSHHQTTLDGNPRSGPQLSRREREREGGRVQRGPGRPPNSERH